MSSDSIGLTQLNPGVETPALTPYDHRVIDAVSDADRAELVDVLVQEAREGAPPAATPATFC